MNESKTCININSKKICSLDAYKELYGSDITSENKKKEALKMALDTRKFEIELYWKRAGYFWAFIALAFGAFFLLLKEETIADKMPNFYNEGLLGISLFGVFLSLCWFFVNKGAKYWQENWEKHVDLLENDVMGPLYKTTAEDDKSFFDSVNPFKSYKYSVGKINLYLSFTVVLIWIVIVFNRLSIIFEWPEPCKFFNEIAMLLGFVLLIAFGCWNFTSSAANGSKKFIMNTRSLETSLYQKMNFWDEMKQKVFYCIKGKCSFQKHLYVIGNGFDIHHDINSRYSDYHAWLKKNEKSTLDDIENFFGRNDDEFWNEFEKNLSDVNVGEIYTEIANNIPNISSPSFRDSDYSNAVEAIEFHLKETFNKIKNSFKRWVASLKQPNKQKTIKIHKDKSLFINFNYTDTLESLYNINEKNIEYIHGKSKRDDDLILGHGTEKDIIKENVKKDSPLNKKDPDCLDVQDSLFDDALNRATNEIHSMRKNVNAIMQAHQTFFSKISRYSFIHVYGLSFGEIDLPYLKKIVDIIGKNKVFFEISDYNGYARARIESFMKKNNVKRWRYKIIELASLIKDVEAQ